MYNVFNNIISITLPYAGTYDCDVSFPTNLVPSSTDACNTQYCISTNSTSPDSGVSGIVSSYAISLGSQRLLVSLTYRHII